MFKTAMSTDRLLLGIACGIVLTSGLFQLKQEENQLRYDQQRVVIPPPPQEKWEVVRSYNYKAEDWNYYSDQDIRDMREKMSYDTEGRYLYTPGRNVKSHDQMIEDYIEDNIEELMDKYRD